MSDGPLWLFQLDHGWDHGEEPLRSIVTDRSFKPRPMSLNGCIRQCHPYFRKIFKPRIVGEAVSSPTKRHPLYSLQHPPIPSHYLVMAHFNNNNSFYSASTVPDEFDSYWFLRCQDSATTEEIIRWTTPTFASGRATVSQPGPTIDLSATLLATGYGE